MYVKVYTYCHCIYLNSLLYVVHMIFPLSRFAITLISFLLVFANKYMWRLFKLNVNILTWYLLKKVFSVKYLEHICAMLNFFSLAFFILEIKILKSNIRWVRIRTKTRKKNSKIDCEQISVQTAFYLLHLTPKPKYISSTNRRLKAYPIHNSCTYVSTLYVVQPLQ